MSKPFYCIYCGECRVETTEDGRIVIHNDAPHPAEYTYDEEERPQ